MRVRGDGPIPARIMLVGEAPGAEEERQGLPFVGASGQELNRMLHEAGIMRSDCYVTNVCKVRPRDNNLASFIAKAKKDITANHRLLRDKYCTQEVHDGCAELDAEIEMVQPNLIITFGNLALWALTGNWGVLKWRGSLLGGGDGPKIIPTIHPAAILRQWELRAITVNDLRRAKRHLVTKEYSNIPQWKFNTRPSYTNVLETLNKLINQLDQNSTEWDGWVDFDIETRIGHVACIGISWSRLDALCIPLMDRSKITGYWHEEEEAQVLFTLYKLLTHTNVKVRGQNLLFDCQYIYRYFHFIPRVKQDTMISQHSAFAAMPKSLAFIASMYADYYVFWKEDK